MPTEIVTRKFQLDMKIDDSIFSGFRKIVNNMIEIGIKLDDSIFINDGLQAVKRFYNKINSEIESNGFNDRVLRCAAQYAYFSVREYKTRLKIVKAITTTLKTEQLDSNELHKKIIVEYNDNIPLIWLDNLINHCINVMSDLLKLQNFVLPSVVTQMPLLDLISYKKSFLRALSRKLTRQFNQGKRTRLIMNILRSDDADWDKQRKLWRDKKFTDLQTPQLETVFEESLTDAKANLSSSKIVDIWLDRSRSFKGINGDTDEDFRNFVKGRLQSAFELIIVNQLNDILEAESRKIFEDISSNVEKYEKVPCFKGNSIPLGPDDNRVFVGPCKESDYSMTFRFRRGEKIVASFKDTSGYVSMLEDGFVPKKGVLLKKGNKLLLAVPFEKDLPSLKKRTGRVAGIDLGLKTFAVASIVEDKKEISRKFIDQKDLSIMEHSFDKSTFYNFKRRLMILRFRVSLAQSSMASLKNLYGHKGRNLVEYQDAKRSLKKSWCKIKNIHNELAIKVALEVVKFSNENDVYRVNLEDLRFAKHSLKRQVGYWLATWQLHWFFAQVQYYIRSFCRREGIRVSFVSARNTSKLCSSCGILGTRDGKRFECDCGFRLDADLNAARNIAKSTP